MPTLQKMIDEVISNLSGYGMRQDNLTYLTSAVTSSATSAVVASTESLGKGVIEIDDELIWVDSFDRASGTLVIPPFGRGHLDTVAASHASGAKVTVNPTFPRASIKNAINDTILATYPLLWGVASTSFNFRPTTTTYDLPADVETVLSVTWESIGPSKRWIPVKNWSVDGMSNIGAFSSGNSLTILAAIPGGRTVNVFYNKQPDPLEYNSDDFALVTGLPDSAKDVIILGATHRLLSNIEPSRLNFSSPEADVQSGRIGYGTGTSVAKYVYALYQQRLQEEASKLLARYPTRPHYMP